MPGLVLQPVDQAVELVLAQELSCWARTSSGGVDPLVRYDTGCASPTGGALGRFTIAAAACDRYGPLPFTAGGQPIPCNGEVSTWTPYLITAADITGIDPNSCSAVPVTASVLWEPDPEVMTAVAATVLVSGEVGGVRRHTVMIDWGDGTAPQQASSGQPVVHDYGESGDYIITAWPIEHPGGRGEAPVVVKAQAPTVHVYSDPDDDWRALLWVDEPGNGTVYRIDWGDGSAPEHIQRDPPPYPRVPHDYGAAGTYTATVTDTGTKRSTTVAFDAGGMGVLFTFPTDDAIPHLVVTRMRVGATWTLDWGDGTAVQTGTVPANASLRTSHTTVMAPGTYTVTVEEIIDGLPRRTLVRELVIPSVFSLQMNVSMAWRMTDPHTISVTPTDTPPEVLCTVDWGDGSAPVEIAGGATASHTYTSISPEGYLVSVEEQTDGQRRFHRLIGEPSFIGTPHLSAWSRWSAEIVIRGIPGLSNADWYGIDWGDGNNQLIAAVGADWNAWHQYTAPGTYTLHIDAPGMDSPVLRSIQIPTYPQPVVTAAEDETDATRMTTLITVDNTACGGEVELAFGDGTVAIAGASATVSHQYATAGAYTVIARCLADPTARGRVNVEVPYGQEQTLAATIGPVSSTELRTARLTVTAYTDGKPVTVAWGDGDAENFQPPTSPTHAYAFDDNYSVVIKYVDDTESLTIPITIPFEGALLWPILRWYSNRPRPTRCADHWSSGG